MNIAIIGAGPAGIEAASVLAKQHQVTLFEKEAQPLCNIRDKAFLFPDFSSADELADKLEAKLQHPNITLKMSTPVATLNRTDNQWMVSTASGEMFPFDAVLLTTGYRVFDAHQKEELGYGIYKGVITSLEMEKMIKENQVRNIMNEVPKQIVFLQCVGSRDEKSGNHYCSKVCCVTAVKQAIEVKKQHPETDVYIFYMDLRMFGRKFEDLYLKAQKEHGVRFVRGRVSEVSEDIDGHLIVKAEDTLFGKPMKIKLDLLVLMAGMAPAAGTAALSRMVNASLGDDGFFAPRSIAGDPCSSTREGIFLAGAATGPKTLPETLGEAASAALAIDRYLKTSAKQ